MALEKEIETYNKNYNILAKDAGKFVVIQGDEIVGIYANYEDALKIAYDKFGTKEFLIKKIAATEEVQFFTRDILNPCRI